jgi:hypothetical protein
MPMTYIDSRGKSDAHDIAGEEALEDQQQWQQEALNALDDFITSNEAALDAIPSETHNSPHERSTWEADRAMDPTDPLNAIKIVFDMAMHGATDPDGPDAEEMEDEINEQQQALDMTLDLLGLHSDKVNSIGTTFSA